MKTYFCEGCGREVSESDLAAGGHVDIVSAHAEDASCREGEHANCPVAEQVLCGPVVEQQWESFL